MLSKALTATLLILCLITPGAMAAPAEDSADASVLLYFYVTPCEDCAAVKELLNSLGDACDVTTGGKTLRSPIAVKSYNAGAEEGLGAIRSLFDRYHVPQDKQVTPIIFLRDSYLSGREDILARLEQKLRAGDALGTREPGAGATPPALTGYEWPGIFLTGLVNGFNPCSISMLLFLITLLLARSASVMKMGLAFITGKFIAYLALGTVLFNLLLSIDNAVFAAMQNVLKYVLLAVALAAVAVNLSDFAAAKNEKYNKIRLQLPAGLRRLNHRWLKKVSDVTNARLLLLLSLALGLVISAGEFLCTGQIYLATIIYLMKRSPALDWQTMGAFLVYVAGMMLPPLALTLAVWKGREVFHLSELARRNMPLIKLVNAAVFLVFGAVLLIGM